MMDAAGYFVEDTDVGYDFGDPTRHQIIKPAGKVDSSQ